MGSSESSAVCEVNRGSWASRAEGYSERLGWGEKQELSDLRFSSWRPSINYVCTQTEVGGGGYFLYIYIAYCMKKKGGGGSG